MSINFDPNLITLIRCPVTKSRLAKATAKALDELNQRIIAGSIVDQSGRQIDTALDCGFFNEDQSLLFPVREGILILIADKAILNLSNEADASHQ